MVSVSEDKPRLFHYTTADGLLGIVRSQQIYATSIRYLNDSKEQFGYLEHRLPSLLYSSAEEALRSRGPDEVTPVVGALSSSEISEQAKEFTERLVVGIRDLSAKLDDPYVTSFSAPSERDPDDGLLSQWRAYGSDGGYAIVFDTARLERLLVMESVAYHHQALLISDVEYYGDSNYANPRSPESVESERLIRAAVKDFIRTGTQDSLEPMCQPLMQLSVTSKHHGFREESEVRIVALRSVPEVWEAEREGGECRPLHDLCFRQRDGLLIPYLALFGQDKLGEDAKLPIMRVIVGPHPDQSRRREAVKRLLQQYKVSAEVSVSSIPYMPA